MLLLLYHVSVQIEMLLSVQIENNRFRIDKSASSNQLLFLTTAQCNATLASDIHRYSYNTKALSYSNSKSPLQLDLKLILDV